MTESITLKKLESLENQNKTDHWICSIFGHSWIDGNGGMFRPQLDHFGFRIYFEKKCKRDSIVLFTSTYDEEKGI